MPQLSKFNDFAAITTHLDGLSSFHWDLSLERIGRVLGRLTATGPGSSAQKTLAVQVVGTNGKGSTASFLAALGQAHSLRVGLYTSPHFVSVRERIMVDGRILPESEWVACANLVWRAGGQELTYFEFITALAVAAFARAGVELVVWEAGLGGRHDATTALPVDLVLFTPMSLDHEAVLGAGLAAIAADKADALAQGRGIRAAITAGQEFAALTALQNAAARLGCPLLAPAEVAAYPESTHPKLDSLGLAGPHQRGNAQLALAAWHWLAANFSLPNTESGRLAGLRQAFIPGRLQFIPADPAHGLPPLILDGAHNAHGLQALAEALHNLGISPAAIIFSALADKDMRLAGEILPGLTSGPIFIPPVKDNPRAAAPADLAALFGSRAKCAPDLAAALSLAGQALLPSPAGPENPILVCGSLYLLGEFYTLHPEYLEPPSAKLTS